MAEGLFSWLDPQWLASQIHDDAFGSFAAWTLLILAAGLAVGRIWDKRSNEAMMLREVAKREEEIRDYQEQVSVMLRQIEKSSEIMEESKTEMLRSVEFGEKVREHISSQDEQLESFFNTILKMNSIIDEMNGIITSLTKDRMAMLSDAERDALEFAYRSGLPCEIADEGVAEHLVSLGALDRLSTGKYAVSGEWRRSMSAMPEYGNSMAQ